MADAILYPAKLAINPHTLLLVNWTLDIPKPYFLISQAHCLLPHCSPDSVSLIEFYSHAEGWSLLKNHISSVMRTLSSVWMTSVPSSKLKSNGLMHYQHINFSSVGRFCANPNNTDFAASSHFTIYCGHFNIFLSLRLTALHSL